MECSSTTSRVIRRRICWQWLLVELEECRRVEALCRFRARDAVDRAVLLGPLRSGNGVSKDTCRNERQHKYQGHSVTPHDTRANAQKRTRCVPTIPVTTLPEWTPMRKCMGRPKRSRNVAISCSRRTARRRTRSSRSRGVSAITPSDAVVMPPTTMYASPI